MEIEIKGFGVVEVPDETQAIKAINAFHANPSAGMHYDTVQRTFNNNTQRIEPVASTLRDRIFNRAIDFLVNPNDDPITRQNAIRRANSVTEAFEFLPGIGDALLVSDTNKAFEDENYLEAAVLAGVTAIGAIPVIGDVGAKALRNPAVRNAADRLNFLHNTSAEKLVRAENMGGMPMPSLAVTRQDIPFDEFGDITLIGRPSSFDPKVSRLNQVFDADAYTVRAPSPVRVANNGAGKRFQDEVADRLKGYGGYTSEVSSNIWNLEKKGGINEADFNQVQRYFQDDSAMDALFLESKGIAVPVDDVGAVKREEIRGVINPLRDERKQWGEELFNDYFGADEFFISNPNRDFYQTRAKLIPYNVDSVTRFMKKTSGRGGEGGMSATGIGAQRAATTSELKSLPQIRANMGNLAPREYIEAIKDSQNNEFFSLADSLKRHYKYDGESFRYLDEVSELIQLSESRGMQSALNEIGFENVPDGVISQVEAYKNNLRQAPTQYFEAKPKRPVSLDEFSGAIIPESTPQNTIDMLKSKGIQIERYNTPEQRRILRDRFGGAAFSLGGAGIGTYLYGQREDKKLNSI